MKQDDCAGQMVSHRLRGECMEQMEDGFGGAQSKEITVKDTSVYFVNSNQ